MLQLEAPVDENSVGKRKNNKNNGNNRGNGKPSPKEVSLAVRIVLAIVFAILGFTFSNEIYFDKYPLFGTPFVAEVLTSLATALIGFYVIPKAFSAVKHWIWQVTFQAVSDIVTDFWEKQAEKMKEAREEREEKKQAAKEAKLKEDLKGGMVVDTSVLIDGRILDIAKTGILSCALIVPEFVIDELHTLSDSKDSMKRRKGRRGLDFLKNMRKDKKVNLIVTDDLEVLEEGVDKSLVKYAKMYGVGLMTLDFNLNKVAGVSGIRVVNINDLANALRMRFLPGEELEIKIVDIGQEEEQGVGYLEDGTMVVVDKGADLVGKEVSVCVKKNIQGSAGRMIFAELNS